MTDPNKGPYTSPMRRSDADDDEDDKRAVKVNILGNNGTGNPCSFLCWIAKMGDLMSDEW